LHEAIEVMAATYCGTLSLEYKHLQQQDEMAWMQARFESRQPLSKPQKRQVRAPSGCRAQSGCWAAQWGPTCCLFQPQVSLQLLLLTHTCVWLKTMPALRGALQVLRWLLAAQGFEQFLSRKFPASKRFGLEGCEALLPGLLALVETGAASGLRKVKAGGFGHVTICALAQPLSIHL
jgi:hypothetical protein